MSCMTTKHDFQWVIMSSSASADNPYLDLDYSGYHKNLIQQLFIIYLCLLEFKDDYSQQSIMSYPPHAHRIIANYRPFIYDYQDWSQYEIDWEGSLPQGDSMKN